jgi:copper chaperone CopZ
MQKVPGVTGVGVSLNEGLTVIDLKPDNTVTLAALRQVIRNNGFVTRSAEIIARGIVTMVGNRLTFEVSGSRERLALESSDKVRAQAEIVEVVGTADLTDPKALKLKVQTVRRP